MNRYLKLALLLLIPLVAAVGCEQKTENVVEKRPRPVQTSWLRQQRPPKSPMVTASVGAWKTEQLGFEVGGRVESVAEPNTEIEGRLYDEMGQLIIPGTPVAQLESERYRLQVDRAKANVARAEQNVVASETELNESLPAQVQSAEASLELARIEFERSQKLFEQEAGSQQDVDRDKAEYENATSRLKQLDAQIKAQQADLASVKSSLLQAKQDLRDAERNLDDCTLYSSFRGQVADIDVVPGSVVTAGQAVATVQMMDPIKIELEVSAEESRRLKKTEMLPVEVPTPFGNSKTVEGFLYLVDPVADPRTRTFTVTLLVMNKKIIDSNVDELDATTDQTWRLDFNFLPGAEEGMLFVGEKALLQDDEGYYLWQITNHTLQSRTPEDGIFHVRKLRVRKGPRRIPYLGNWVFQQVLIDDKDFDPQVNGVIGELTVEDGLPEEWDGDRVLLDVGGQWMLRPGDLVKVDLAGNNAAEGYFVPMDAIVRKGDKTFIFTVDSKDGESTAKRVEVRLMMDTSDTTTSSLRRIEPLEGQSLEGLQFVTAGAHYLIDGEPIKPTTMTEPTQ